MGEEIRLNSIKSNSSAGAVKMVSSLFVLVYLLYSNVIAAPVNLYRQDIFVPLEYDYLPGEHYWSKFGSIDSRKFDLRIGKLEEKNLGKIITDEGYQYILWPQKKFNDYFSNAVTTILSHYGITLVSMSAYQLEIYPLHAEFTSADLDEDSDKICTIKLKARLIKNKTTVMFEGVVENRGIVDFDADDADDYADLLDKTVHGAIVKLWASRVLFVDKPLGQGKIIKKEQGVYGFLPNVHALKDTDQNDTADAPGQTPFSKKAIVKDPLLSEEGEVAQVITGTYTGSDSVVVEEGTKITIGVLPFENATGREKLSSVAKEIRELLQVQLSKSRTVKVMDREKLSDILREQALGLTGALNDSTVVQVGNISGVRAMVAGKLTTSGSYYRLNARIINVETSAIVTAVSVNIPDANTITSGVPELAAKLLYEFTEEKIEVNRNSMSYPSVSPIGATAVTASVEDAWAVDINPAALMKVKKRDANFFVSFGKKLTGRISSSAGPEIESKQPPFEKMGVNVALPIGLRSATGFSILHQYSYPRLENAVGADTYKIKEEETIFTIPLAFGINPKLSFGLNLSTHIMEYQITNPGFEYRSGSIIYLDGKFAVLFKVSERFRAGMTFLPESYYMRAREKTGPAGDYKDISRKTTAEFRFGTAMYPLKWLFFFADLEYEKQPGNAKIQPGFYLGLQLNYFGKPFNIKFFPQYGMMPLYISYAHEPFNKITDTQAKYISFGTGYFLNNIYVRWSLRFNVEKEEDRQIVAGLPEKSSVRLFDYRLSTPVFLCVGYRF